MEFACFDESGDTGTDDKSSKYIVLGLMCTEKIDRVRRVIRWATNQMNMHKKTKAWLIDNGEIKSYNFPDKDLLKRILKKLSEIEIEFYCLVINKKHSKERVDKNVILSSLLQHIIVDRNGRFPDSIIADTQFFNKNKENRFVILTNTDGGVNVFALRRVGQYLPGFKEFGRLVIKHVDSKKNKEIQATDLICGSIYKAYEKGDQAYIACLRGGLMKLNINEK